MKMNAGTLLVHKLAITTEENVHFSAKWKFHLIKLGWIQTISDDGEARFHSKIKLREWNCNISLNNKNPKKKNRKKRQKTAQLRNGRDEINATTTPMVTFSTIFLFSLCSSVLHFSSHSSPRSGLFCIRMFVV